MRFQDILAGNDSDDIFDMKNKRELDLRRKITEEEKNKNIYLHEDFSENHENSDMENHENSDMEDHEDSNMEDYEESNKENQNKDTPDDSFYEKNQSSEQKKKSPEQSGKPYADKQSEDGLKLRMHSLPICNCNQGFCYSSSYRIPYERYLEVFGNSFTFHRYLLMSLEPWGGNCFGMALMNIQSYLHKLKADNYYKPDVSLSQTAYDGIAEYGGKKYCFAEKKSSLTAMIERLFLLQFSSAYIDLVVKQTNVKESEVQRMQRYYNNIVNKKKPYLVLIWWQVRKFTVGHALCVESGREPVNLGNDWKRIYLCDSNYPFHDFSGQKCMEYYNDSHNRYIDINISTGEWKMEAMVNANGGNLAKQNLIGSHNHTSYMIMLDAETLPSDFKDKMSFHSGWSQKYNTFYYNAEHVTISDLAGNTICTVENGAMHTEDSKNLINIPVAGVTADGIFSGNMGHIILPQKSIVVHVEGGYVRFDADDTSLGFGGKSPYTVKIKDGNYAEITSDHAVMVNVCAWAGDMEKYTSWMTDLEISERACTVSVDRENMTIKTGAAQTINVDVINEEKTFNIGKVSTLDGLTVKSRGKNDFLTKDEQNLTK